MIISFIVAAARNRVIGRDNRMIWKLSDDMKRFRRLTTGHHVLMGRKTFESLGRPLKNRTNIIVTRQEDYKAEGAEVFHSVDAAMAFARENGEEELFIIGGGEIYTMLLPAADRIYLTRVLADPEGDAYFPEIDGAQWRVILEEAHLADDRNDHDFVFIDMERRGTKSAGGSFPDMERE